MAAMSLLSLTSSTSFPSLLMPSMGKKSQSSKLSTAVGLSCRMYDRDGRKMAVGDLVAWTGRFGEDTVSRPSEMGLILAIEDARVKVAFARASLPEEIYDFTQEQVRDKGIMKVEQ
mmetsp:Transcript_3075/g.6915  ORF Transcript_3075/g.6915 Transcript_3075/m.6915 type:complete len:116 (+) Transcript_3075:155-502(+)